MARTKTPEEIAATPGEFSEIDRDNALDEQAILASLDSDPGEVKWMIRAYRIPPDGGPDALLFKLAHPKEIENIGDRLMKYGSGNYRIRAYKNGQLFKYLTYPIEAPPIPEANPASEVTSVLSSMAQTIERQGKENREFMERIFNQRPQRTETDPLEQMERMSTIFANMQGSRTPAEQNTMQSVIEMFKLGLETGKASTGTSGGDGDASPMSLIKAFLDGGGLSLLSPQANAPAPSPVAPSVQGGRTPIQQRMTPPPQLTPSQMLLGGVIARLGEYAKQNAQVSQAARWTGENLPPAMLDQILSDPGFLDSIAASVPVVAEQRGWFAALFEELRNPSDGSFNDLPSSDNTDSTGNRWDTGNAQGDAASPTG